MRTAEKFENLKTPDIEAKSEKERAELDEKFEHLAIDNPDGPEQAVMASARRTLEAAKQLKVKEQISEISKIVSMSYIAKTYFNKTKSWMSQRINELNVNGRPAQFTSEEIEILNAALKDISEKLGTFRVSC